VIPPNVAALIARLERTARLHPSWFFSFDCAEAAEALRQAYGNQLFTKPAAAGKVQTRRKSDGRPA